MRKILLITVLFSILKISFSQDPILTNTLTNPINTNPAFAGSKEMVRFSASNQLLWISAIQKCSVNSFSTDFSVNKIGIGISGIYNTSNQLLKHTDVDAAVSYGFGNIRKFIFRPGIKFSYLNRSLDVENLVFYDQLNVYDGQFTDFTSANVEDIQNINIFDLGAGFISQFPVEIRRTEPAWINLGFAAHHIPEHYLTYMGISENLYPKKYTLHGGIYLPVYKKNKTTKLRERTLINFYPNFRYQKQDVFSAVDIGLIAFRNPFLVGITARSFDRINISNKNQIIGTIGTEVTLGEYINLQILYSIDWAVTGNNHISYSASFLTHEFSIQVLFANKRKSDCSTKLKYNKLRWFNNNELQVRVDGECPPGKTPRRTSIDTKPMFYPIELPQPYIGF